MNQEVSTNEYVALKEVATLKYAKVYYSLVNKAMVVQATSNYIPMDDFKQIFSNVLDLAKTNATEKIVFDKRALSIFHQPSMAWYFTEWKAELAALGIKKHAKILPDDLLFNTSVKLARQKLDKDHPNALYHQLQIQYFESLSDALKW